MNSFSLYFFAVLILIGCRHSTMTTVLDQQIDIINQNVKKSIEERINKKLNQSIIIGVVTEKGFDVFAQGNIVKGTKSIIPNSKTQYEIGSVTKVFTGLLLAQHVVAGKLKLSDSIAPYLPDHIKFEEHIQQIKWSQLVSHTSGLSRTPRNLREKRYKPNNPYAHYTEKMLLDDLSKFPVKDNNFRYSNYGAGLVGHLLGKMNGMTYYEALQEKILSPIGMVHTNSKRSNKNVARPYTYNVEVANWDFNATAGAGELKSNIHDLLLFLAAQMELIETDVKSVIKMSQEAIHSVDSTKSVGFFWGIYTLPNGDTLYRHNGGTGGFRSFIGFKKEAKTGVVVLTNSSQTGVDDLGLHQLDTSCTLNKTGQMSIAQKVSELLETATGEFDIDQTDTTNTDYSWKELNLLGYTYLKHGQFEKAIQVFKFNTQLYPNSADGYDSLGEAYYKSGNLEEALDVFNHVLSLDSNYQNAKRMIGFIKKEMNE